MARLGGRRTFVARNKSNKSASDPEDADTLAAVRADRALGGTVVGALRGRSVTFGS